MMRKAFLFIFLYSISLATLAAFLPPVSATSAMVVSSQRYASQVGQQILQQGGNAVDAAVAMGYALSVVDPRDAGLGGGGFMLVHWVKTNKNDFLNFREKAPENISDQLFFRDGKLKQNIRSSYLMVGIPGTVMGLNAALKRYGTMTLQQVMAPAIRLAKKGFIILPTDAEYFQRYADTFRQYANVAAIFLKNGRAYRAGERLVQPQLAKVLTAISEKGTRVFYQGWIAKAIVKASQQQGGVLGLFDFENYHVEWMEPLQCLYHGYQVITAPPPGSGVTVCEILNIVSTYHLDALGFHAAKSIRYNVEAMRYAFADRNQYIGDPNYVNNPIQRLLSPVYASQIRNRMAGNKAGRSSDIGIKMNINKNTHTTHYSLIDRNGNAVSVTLTLNSYFGTRRIAGNTGFFLNNELDDFTLKPGVPNQFKLKQGQANLIGSNRRPLSSMSPTILLKNRKPVMILGAAGGPTIITSIVQTIENVVDYQMNINAAVNMPRYHMQWMPDKIYMEPFAFSNDTQAILRKMGYQLQLGSPFGGTTWGQVAAISVNPKTGLITGASDNRVPSGQALGINK